MVAVVFSSVTAEKHIARAQIDKDGGPKACSGARPHRTGKAWAEFRPCFEQRWARSRIVGSSERGVLLYASFTRLMARSCPPRSAPSA